MAVVESPECTSTTRSCLPSPAKSYFDPPPCHSLEPTNTAAMTTPMTRLSRIPRVVFRRRRSRSARARSAREPLRRAEPTATGRARSRPSDTVDLPGRHGPALVEPTLQDCHRRRLVDDPTLTLGADPGLA